MEKPIELAMQAILQYGENTNQKPHPEAHDRPNGRAAADTEKFGKSS